MYVYVHIPQLRHACTLTDLVCTVCFLNNQETWFVLKSVTIALCILVSLLNQACNAHSPVWSPEGVLSGVEHTLAALNPSGRVESGAHTGCTESLRESGAHAGCTESLRESGAHAGCTESLRESGAHTGCTESLREVCLSSMHEMCGRKQTRLEDDFENRG